MKNAISTLNSLREINDVTPLAESDSEMVYIVTPTFSNLDNEVLLETTDIAARTQLIRPVPKSSLESETYVETSWRLDTGQPMMHCVCRRDPDTGDHAHYHVKKSIMRM